jgi:hypothetical protein
MSNIRLAVAIGLFACGRPAVPGSSIASLSFPDRGGHVWLPVRLPNGTMARWNLDSGFETSAIDAATARRAGVAVHGPETTAAPGGSIDQAWTGRLCVTVGSASFCPDRMASIPLAGLSFLVGADFPGILGHDFFERYVVRIDYQRRVVTLEDPERFSAPPNARPVPVSLESGEPFLVATLFLAGRATPAKLKIDTGSLDFMGLNGSFVAQTKLVPSDHRRMPAPGVAVGGATENWVTRLDSMAIGGLPTFVDPPIGWSASTERVGDAGTIGARLLSRFIVTFDYRRHRLWLEPVERTDSIESDASGAIVGAPDSARRSRVIAALAPGSPAEHAGLRIGDSILTVDGRPADRIDLFELRRWFERPHRTYRLTIGRGGGEHRRTIALETVPWP